MVGALVTLLVAMVLVSTISDRGAGDEVSPVSTTTTTVAATVPVSGAEVFAVNCAECHGPGGDGSSIGPSLIGNDLSIEAIATQLEFGSPNMPAWQNGLTPQELEVVIDHVAGL